MNTQIEDLFKKIILNIHEKNFDQAEALLKKLLNIDPNNFIALNILGVLCGIKKNHEDAFIYFRRAIHLKPDYNEAWYNKGNTLKELKRYDEALYHYDKAIHLKPDYAQAWNNKAITLQDLKRYDEALNHYDKAIHLKPDYNEAWYNKGNTLKELKRYDEALYHYDKAIHLKPDLDFAFGQILHLKMLICDWSTFNSSVKTCIDGVENSKKIIHPFLLLGLIDDLKLHLNCSKIFANDRNNVIPILGPVIKVSKKKKIRIGYYSADFHNHATSYLIAELLEKHDKNFFEVYGFSFGPNSNDDYQKRVSKAFDKFNIVNNLTDIEVASLSRRIGIDIAIDLKGYTMDCRPNLFSYRSAPIQVNYLGYPGSTGVNYMDYIIADNIIIPTQLNNLYSEKIIYLPDSYQPNDSKRKISDKIFTRKELNIPEDSFIFCCFNNTYKILPEIFNLWIEILKKVENSVLWLLDDSMNSIASKNLKKEARARGISDQRLIFSKKIPSDENLARLKLADLFLDTFPYNAHTTCSDALWAGVPVLTYSGESFASRVAASLLNSLGLKELVADSLDHYKAIAIQLAKNKNELFSIKEKLSIKKITSPLFNTNLFTKNLEKAYKIIYTRHLNNLSPENIEIN